MRTTGTVATRDLLNGSTSPKTDRATFGLRYSEAPVTTLLGGAVDRAAVRAIASRASGNPLFIWEFVTGSCNVASLTLVGGLWRF
jgi:hypothetical protein